MAEPVFDVIGQVQSLDHGNHVLEELLSHTVLPYQFEVLDGAIIRIEDEALLVLDQC